MTTQVLRAMTAVLCAFGIGATGLGLASGTEAAGVATVAATAGEGAGSWCTGFWPHRTDLL